MPNDGKLVLPGTCGGAGICTGACRFGLAVSSTTIPPQPPLLLGICTNQIMQTNKETEGRPVSDLTVLPEVLDQVVPVVQHC